MVTIWSHIPASKKHMVQGERPLGDSEPLFPYPVFLCLGCKSDKAEFEEMNESGQGIISCPDCGHIEDI